MKKMVTIGIIGAAGLLLAGAVQAQGGKVLKKCPVDAVVSGTVCMDKYEATVWRITDPLGAGSGLVKKVKSCDTTKKTEFQSCSGHTTFVLVCTGM